MRKRLILTIIAVLAVTCAASSPSAAQVPRVFAKNSASFADGLTPGIVSLFPGSSRPFVQIAASAAALPLPTELLGVRVSIGGHLAPLFFVSPGQINCLIDERFAGRTVGVAVYSFNNLLYYSEYHVSPSFGVFSADARGQGLAAAVVFDTSLQSFRSVATTDNQPIGIEPTSGGQPNYLILYGTGANLAGRNVEARIDGIPCAVSFAGPAPGLVGASQLNVALSPVFADRGWTPVRVFVDGVGSNEVWVFFK